MLGSALFSLFVYLMSILILLIENMFESRLCFSQNEVLTCPTVVDAWFDHVVLTTSLKLPGKMQVKLRAEAFADLRSSFHPQLGLSN